MRRKPLYIALALSAVFLLSAPSFATTNEPEPPAITLSAPQSNYMAEMQSAAITGNAAAGQAAEAARNEKIAAYGLDYGTIAWNDIYLLSKIMYAEAGSDWLSDEWKMCVGEVVLNRTESPEFPDTIAEVLAQPGQYYGANSSYFENIRPNERCVKLALRLLEGERNMLPSVVFQSYAKQGSGVYLALYDQYLGWTYFCFSYYPELYE